eukprot:TRINITY_DN29929_c0_g2_i1.p1 TRINITY_DN29929_c0_g2~~TRINITY_DN29929_c0_g2_i1.p1  ORF type:complete len:909 (-),score=270.01 TRINITY_DN29929_c0_g2_i1:258-2984(-)
MDRRALLDGLRRDLLVDVTQVCANAHRDIREKLRQSIEDTLAQAELYSLAAEKEGLLVADKASNGYSYSNGHTPKEVKSHPAGVLKKQPSADFYVPDDEELKLHVLMETSTNVALPFQLREAAAVVAAPQGAPPLLAGKEEELPLNGGHNGNGVPREFTNDTGFSHEVMTPTASKAKAERERQSRINLKLEQSQLCDSEEVDEEQVLPLMNKLSSMSAMEQVADRKGARAKSMRKSMHLFATSTSSSFSEKESDSNWSGFSGEEEDAEPYNEKILYRWGCLVHGALFDYRLDPIWEEAAREPGGGGQFNFMQAKKVLRRREQNRRRLSDRENGTPQKEDYQDDGEEQIVAAQSSAFMRASSVMMTMGCASSILNPSQWVMSPQCRKRLLWDLLGMVLFSQDMFMIPLQAFDCPRSLEEVIQAFGLIAAIFWTLDVFVSFFTGYYTSDAQIEFRLGKVAVNYIRSWFALDMMICGAEWLTRLNEATQWDAASNADEASTYLKYGKMASRTLRVFRLLRFFKISKALNKLLQGLRNENARTGVQLAQQLAMIFISSHYICCIWYAISSAQSGPAWVKVFLKEDHLMEYAYFTSLHWALTQFTPASMEVTPKNVDERMFVCLVIVLALVMFSSFVSSITQAMTHLKQFKQKRASEESKLRLFFHERGVPRDLAARVLHLAMREHKQEGMPMLSTEIQMFNKIPSSLREELTENIFAPTMVRHPFFMAIKLSAHSTMKKLCFAAVSEKRLQPEEEWLSEGQQISFLTFIMHGLLHYQCFGSDAATHDDVASKHEWVCECALWAQDPLLQGRFLAGPNGCQLIMIKRKLFEELALSRKDIRPFLAIYARMFIESFNRASKTKHPHEAGSSSGLFFNDFETIDALVKKAESMSCSLPMELEDKLRGEPPSPPSR